MPATFDIQLNSGEVLQIRDDQWPIVWDSENNLPPPSGTGNRCVLRKHRDGRLLVHGWTWPAASPRDVTSHGELLPTPIDRSKVESAIDQMLQRIDRKLTELERRELKDQIGKL